MKSKLLIFSFLFLLGCSSTKKEDGSSDPLEPVSEFQLNADSDSGTAGALRTVNFAYNSASLDESARAILNANADLIKENSSLSLQIEGHCDERGGVQFNLALGERRAKVVVDYLVAQGVDSDRLSTVSYGKEKPLDMGSNEAAWRRNRRANFVVTGL